MRRSEIAPIGAALLLLAGCGGEKRGVTDPDPQPSAGTASVELQAPAMATDLALRLNVRFGTPVTVTIGAGVSGRVVGGSTSDGALLVVFAPFPNGTIGTIEVPDMSRLSAYRVKVEEIAAADFSVRTTNMDGYAASLEP